MKIWISYFNQIRNFDSSLLPISTAMYDPKWYHDGQGHLHAFFDKNHVLNGLRCEFLCLPKSDWNILESQGKECTKDCSQYHDHVVDEYCYFMSAYLMHLARLDFKKLMKFFESTVDYINQNFKTNIKDIVLMVHEKPERKCAERYVLIDYFKSHNYDLEEWSKEEKHV